MRPRLLHVVRWVLAGAVLTLVVASLVGLAAGALLLRRCVARLGGITGDVLGAVVEGATTATLIVAALASAQIHP